MDIKSTFDDGLNQRERALIQEAREFSEQHLEGITSFDTLEHRRLLKEACSLGLAGIEVPESFGGASASFSTRMRVCEELAHQHAGFAFSLVNHHNIASRIAQSGAPSLQSKLIPPMLRGELFGCTAMTEPQSGSDFTGMKTKAQQTEEGWALNGEKAWITNASFADIYLVYAQTSGDQSSAGIAGFIVMSDDPGFKRGYAYKASGIDGMGVGSFILEDCMIPHDRLLYSPGEGFRAAMRGVNQARVHVAAMNAAMVERALDEAVDYASGREAFGGPVIQNQGLAWTLANAATHLQAMRLLSYTAAKAIDTQQEAQAIAAMAKKYANDHAMPAISACMQAMGAQGLTDETGLSQLLGWAKAFCYTDGTPEMMNERIVRLMRKRKNK